MRTDGRKPDELRPMALTLNYVKNAEGSVLFEMGQTKVLCNASVDDKVPAFLKGAGRGWLTAEYAMLPRATNIRTPRESVSGKLTGRTQEIQRIIGRALRAVTDLSLLGERTVILDCDVIQADGGTRTASITGAYTALVLAMRSLIAKGVLKEMPVIDWLAAVSVGQVNDSFLLDLCYEEDSTALVDMNLAMTAGGNLIEIQGTAEGKPFSKQDMDSMIQLGWNGINQIIQYQKHMLEVLS